MNFTRTEKGDATMSGHMAYWNFVKSRSAAPGESFACKPRVNVTRTKGEAIRR